MQTLLRIVTLSGWGDVMYKNIYGCDQYVQAVQPEGTECRTPLAYGFLAALYFVAFIIIGSWVLLTLFIGVVTTSMNQV